MFSTIRTNFFKGAAKVRVSGCTQGRADTSSIPRTALGLSASFSSQGYYDSRAAGPKGEKTALGSASSNPARVKRPEKTSGAAKKMTTSG